MIEAYNWYAFFILLTYKIFAGSNVMKRKS